MISKAVANFVYLIKSMSPFFASIKAIKNSLPFANLCSSTSFQTRPSLIELKKLNWSHFARSCANCTKANKDAIRFASTTGSLLC